MKNSVTSETRTALNGKKSSAGVFALAVLAGILFIIYVAHAGEPARIERAIGIKKEKLRDVKIYIAENYDTLIGTKEEVQQQNLLKDKPLLTVIKESAESVGLTGNLSAVAPEENKKLGEVTAKVVLRRIRLADMVNFLVYVRSKYPGITDREGRMRLVPRQQGDNWDAFVSLTVKRR